MERFTNAQLAEMHLMYGISEDNVLRATRLYRDRFPDREIPDRRFFTNLHSRLRDTGSYRVNRVHLGRPGNRIVENEQRGIDHFENHLRHPTYAIKFLLVGGDEGIGVRNTCGL